MNDEFKNLDQHTQLSERLLTAEQGVLGSMLIDGEIVGRMLMAVSEDDFQVPENQSVFRAMKELYGQGQGCDPSQSGDRGDQSAPAQADPGPGRPPGGPAEGFSEHR